MKFPVLSLAVAALVTLPPVVFAQPHSPSDPAVVEAPAASPETGAAKGAASGTDVQLQQKRMRYVVLPRPPMERVIEDTDTARQEVTATERQDKLIRQSREPAILRPDLDYSVTSGIQSQNILKALRH